MVSVFISRGERIAHYRSVTLNIKAQTIITGVCIISTEKEDRSAPSFTQNLSPQFVNEGERLTLTCQLEGKPEPDVEWYWNGVLVKPDDMVKVRYSAGTCTLVIAETILDDEGDYTCKATNLEGVATTKTSVQIKPKPAPVKTEAVESSRGESGAQQAPRFKTHPQGQIVQDGDKVVLKCDVTGSPRPDVVWLHNGKEIPNSEDFAYENDNGTYRLLIAEIFPEDTGLYTCEASNAAGDATSSCTVKVIVPDEPDMEGPVFVKFPQSTSIEEGAQAKFNCSFEGDSPVQVKWSKDGQDLEESDRIKLSQDGNSFILEIPSALSTDAGIYSVKATSDKGSSSWMFTLSVGMAI
ncbi:myosin light chain kinase, smooth muscle-like [Liolophura sinensis]|uniref:myosin light chain kinase, smooth muscle-like n=1 Tax=Liolophura sinensis TaxID=3198878 RepID=UPI00315898CF